MNAAVVTVALPATALAIVLLLHSRLRSSLVSAPRDDRWHERHTPSLGAAGIGCAYFAIDAVTTHRNRMVLVLSLAVGLACAGFLPFNLRPNRPAAVFMGDSGSQALGFALACLGLAASWKAAGTTVATLLLP